MIKALPSREYLLARFLYDPDTGSLTWRPRPREHFWSQRLWNSWNARFAGKPAGTVKGSRRIVCLDFKMYFAHRLIWKMMVGEEPPETIDHRDVDAGNNRWENLRPATESEQKCNTRQRRDTVCGRRGVWRDKRDGRICVDVMVNGVRKRLGGFSTIDEAGDSGDKLRRELHGEFYR